MPLENGNGDNGYILQGRSGTASAWITIQNHNGGKVFMREIEGFFCIYSSNFILLHIEYIHRWY